ncbi:MAG: hypothetical protein EOP93_21180 [Lysobacteraceae bacterium]|nr:MAG: hypothetical protein EOP93_21180 [Xanthomonadaceae bacterium]
MSAPHASYLSGTLFNLGPQVLFEDAEGGVVYRPGVVDPDTCQRWFQSLREGIAWKAYQRPMYDRIVDVPRRVASYWLSAQDLPDALVEAAAWVRHELGVPFNAVGTNLYRDGADSVAPHNDKLETLVPGHPIALLSLGATRRMTIRAKLPPREVRHVDLEPGSLLLMSHASQRHHDHGIPKTRAPVGARISLAFRVRPAPEPAGQD